MDIEKFAESKAFTFFDNFYKLMVINLTWVLFLILGLGILTWFPITLTAYIIIGSIDKERQFPLFRAIGRIFVKVYWKLEKIFFIMFIIGIILYVNFRIYEQQLIDHHHNLLVNLGFWMTVILMLLYLFTLIHIFLVSMYFPSFKTFKTIKYAFMISIIFPFQTLFLLALGIGILAIFYFYPPVLPLSFIIAYSLYVYISLKILKPKYNQLSKGKQPLDINEYV